MRTVNGRESQSRVGVSIRLRTKELRLVIDRDRKIVEPAVTIGKLNKVL